MSRRTTDVSSASMWESPWVSTAAMPRATLRDTLADRSHIVRLARRIVPSGPEPGPVQLGTADDPHGLAVHRAALEADCIARLEAKRLAGGNRERGLTSCGEFGG